MKKLKDLLKQGKSVMGTMINTISAPGIARILEAAGFDFFIIDCEHGAFDYTAVAGIAAVARGCDIAVIVRIPKIDRECIQKYCDMGVDGLLIPDVRTVGQVNDVIRYSKYAPEGEKGVSLHGASMGYRRTGGKEFMKKSNEDNLVILQIESAEGVRNADALLSVKGVDAVIFGPNDLTQNLGIWGEFENPVYLDSVAAVVKSAEKHGIFSGNHCGRVEDLERGMELGMRFIVWNYDVGMLMESALRGIERVKGNVNYRG